MSDDASISLEAILRYCAAAAPHPWYPSDHARATGLSRDRLDPRLNDLRVGGLIRLTDWVKDRGQGYVLTPAGEEALTNPRALAQLRSEKIPPVTQAVEELPVPQSRGTPWERGEAIRQSLLSPSTPVVTFVLLAANIVVFLYGLLLAWQHEVPLNKFLSGSTEGVLRETGAITGSYLVNGNWWRLISCCFVHIGLLHLGVNMYSLYAIGPLVERMWGPVRYLVLYLIAGLGGSCAMVIADPNVLGAGASGAIWGLMTSMATWVILNRKYLGPMASVWLRQLAGVFLLNVFISMAPGISAAAHFGGGAAGLLVSIPLNVTRYDGGWRRWLAWVGVLAIPLAFLGVLVRTMETGAAWGKLAGRREVQVFEHVWLPIMNSTLKQVQAVYQKEAEPLLEQHANRRDPKAVEQTLGSLHESQTGIASTLASLQQAGPFRDPEVESARQVSVQYLEELAVLNRMTEDCLKKGPEFSRKEESALEEQGKRVTEARKHWLSLLK